MKSKADSMARTWCRCIKVVPQEGRREGGARRVSTHGRLTQGQGKERWRRREVKIRWEKRHCLLLDHGKRDS